MRTFTSHPSRSALICLCLLSLLAVSCGTETGKVETSAQASKIAGTWIIKSRLVDEKEAPVTQRFMKLHFKDNGTFQAGYRGEENQKWTHAGQGSFSYDPPLLTLFWDSGQVLTLLARQTEPDQLVIHHGRNLAPLKDQEPDEVFVRQKDVKGPTRGPS